MALIHCPECDREISDRVKVCPHCGYPFSEELEKPSQVELTGINIKSKKGNSIFIISIILVLIVVAVIGIRIINRKQAEQAYQESYNAYIDNLLLARILMLDGGSNAEDLCILTLRVWGNAIYEESDIETNQYTRPDGYWVSDFNIALSNLYADPETTSKINNIKSNQDNVKDIMKDLQSPPEGLENCYETISDLYSAYLGITELAINPTGSFNSFSELKNKRVDAFIEAYNKLDMQIPERLDVAEQ